jgi:hypothetical protein
VRPRARPAADNAATASCSRRNSGDAMTNLQCRLKKLEQSLTDVSGLIPYSPCDPHSIANELQFPDRA